MNILKGIVTELRERRLWPVAVALLAGLVAVPIVLSKSPSTSATAQSPSLGGSGSTGHTLAVKLAGGTDQPGLHGPGHDPFAQQGGSTTTPSTGTSRGVAIGGSSSAGTTASIGAGSGSSAAASSGSSSSSTSGSSSASSGGGSSSTPASAPAPSSSTPATPVVKKKPAPTGLTSTESYDVSLEITNSSGGVEPIDPVNRLSPIPSAGQPLLVELGVLQSGKRVLFAVQPGTIVSGPGSCTPGPIDCEILSLPAGAIESVSTQSAGGATIAQFSISGISAVDHGSVAAANKARGAVSQAGAKLLTNSPLSALTLFQYEPSVGAVVDLRNLTVGGN